MRRSFYRFAAAAVLLATLALLGARGERLPATGGTVAAPAAVYETADSALSRLVATIQDRIEREGGCTVDPRTGLAVGEVDAFAVSMAGYEAKFPTPPTRQEIQNYLRRHAAVIGCSQAIFVGAWRDSATGWYYLDLTRLISDEPAALACGRANRQRCIYHLGQRKEIFLTSEVR